MSAFTRRQTPLHLCFLASALAATSGLAQTPAPESASPGPKSANGEDTAEEEPVSDADLESAKQLFRQGVAMRKARDYQRALDYFRKSRAIVPSVPNTINVAFCLEQLGRAAQALELYEELLTQFSDSLTDQEREDIAGSMSELRPKVGSLMVSSNVPALLVVDGRMRGQLPRTAPFRLMPGTHVVRVMQDGYEPFEKEVSIQAGKSASLDALLKALRESGRLRVEMTGEEGAELYVDGARLGNVPWEGTLSAGRHYFFVKTSDARGSAPAAIEVVAGQTILARPEAKPLSGEVRIVVNPPSAELSIDGLSLGRGPWQGQLPVGDHSLEAREEGYRRTTVSRKFEASTTGDVALDLSVDPDHPRWQGEGGELFVEGFGGLAISPELASEAESSCNDPNVTCPSNGIALGAIAGARAGYEFPFHMALEVGAGYLSLRKSLDRELDSSFTDPASGPVGVSYTYSETLHLAGPFVSAGLAYRHGFSETFALDGRAHFGGMFASSRRPAQAQATTARDARSAIITGAGETRRSVAAFAMPSVQARWDIGPLHVLAGVTGTIVLVGGPSSANGGTFPEGSGDCPRVGQTGFTDSVACAPGNSAFSGEQSYGRFFVVAPHVGIGYTL